MHDRPPSFSRFISFSPGAIANDATRTRSRIISSARASTSGASERRFTPNGRSVRSLISAIASASWRKSSVADAMMPSPPAFAVADVSFARRHVAHAGLHDRQLDADQLAERGAQRGVGHRRSASGGRSLGARRDAGS